MVRDEPGETADLVGQVGDVPAGFVLGDMEDEHRPGEMARQVLHDGQPPAAGVRRPDQDVRNGHGVLYGGAHDGAVIAARIGGVADVVGRLDELPRHSGGGEHGADEFHETGGDAHGKQEVEGGDDPAPGHLSLPRVEAPPEAGHFQGVALPGARLAVVLAHGSLDPPFHILKKLKHHRHHLSISTKASIRVLCWPIERSVQSPSRRRKGIPSSWSLRRTADKRAR